MGCKFVLWRLSFPSYGVTLSLSLSRDKPLCFVFYCISFRPIFCIFHRTVFVFVSEKNLEAFAPFHIHIPIQLWFICSFSTQKKKKKYYLFANYVQNSVQMLHLLNSLFNLLVDRFIDILMIASITIHRWGWTRKPCM